MSDGKERGIKAGIMHVLWASLMFWCFALAVFYGCSGEGKNIRVLNMGTGILASQATQMQKQRAMQEEPTLPFTAWSEQKQVTVVNQELYREIQANLIRVCGDSRLVLDGGSWLDWENTEGCLMNKNLCIALFGSTNVVGQKVWILDKEYMVKGLLRGTSNTILVETEEKEEVLLERISVEMPRNGIQEQELQTWSEQFGVEGVSLNFQAYRVFGQTAVRVLPCILFFCILIPVVGKVHREKMGPVARIVYLAAIIWGLGTFLWISGIQLRIPDDWIPSRWSDFEFFANVWKQKTEALGALINGEKSQPELIYATGMVNAVKYSLLSLGFAWMWIRKLKITKCTEAFFWTILFYGLAFCITVMLGENSATDAGFRMIWLLFPWFVWARCGVCWFYMILNKFF